MTLNFKEHHLALENKAEAGAAALGCAPTVHAQVGSAERQHSSADKNGSILATAEEPKIYIPILPTFHLNVLMLTSCSE